METAASVLASIEKRYIMLSVDLERTLLLEPDLPSLETISSVLSQRDDLPAQSPLLWPFDNAPGLHRGSYTGFDMALPVG